MQYFTTNMLQPCGPRSGNSGPENRRWGRPDPRRCVLQRKALSARVEQRNQHRRLYAARSRKDRAFSQPIDCALSATSTPENFRRFPAIPCATWTHIAAGLGSEFSTGSAALRLRRMFTARRMRPARNQTLRMAADIGDTPDHRGQVIGQSFARLSPVQERQHAVARQLDEWLRGHCGQQNV